MDDKATIAISTSYGETFIVRFEKSKTISELKEYIVRTHSMPPYLLVFKLLGDTAVVVKTADDLPSLCELKGVGDTSTIAECLAMQSQNVLKLYAAIVQVVEKGPEGGSEGYHYLKMGKGHVNEIMLTGSGYTI